MKPQPRHVETVCRIGKGADTCRYLTADERGLRCAKLHADAKVVLDHRVARQKMKARADNCDGFPREVKLA